MIIETLKKELLCIEGEMEHMELQDTAWSPAYTKLCKTRRILKKTIKRLERLEVHSNGKGH